MNWNGEGLSITFRLYETLECLKCVSVVKSRCGMAFVASDCSWSYNQFGMFSSCRASLSRRMFIETKLTDGLIIILSTIKLLLFIIVLSAILFSVAFESIADICAHPTLFVTIYKHLRLHFHCHLRRFFFSSLTFIGIIIIMIWCNAHWLILLPTSHNFPPHSVLNAHRLFKRIQLNTRYTIFVYIPMPE